MHLVDDEHPVATLSRRELDLLDHAADILDAVVGCGVKLDNIERAAFVERGA